MKFKDPWILFLLLPLLLVLLRVYYEIHKKRYAPKLIIPWKKTWNLSSLSTKISPRFWTVLGYGLACTFFVLAAARPQTSFHKTKRHVEGIDMVLVLDISASMRIEDFRDENRIETAKQILKDFVLGRQNDKIGLVVFSGEPITLVPPTLDHSLLLYLLENTQIGDLKDGTAIGDALSMGVGRLKESRAKSKILILVTDGDSNIGQVDPLTGGELAKGFGIRVYSIAIGREGRVAMPFIQKDLFGRQVKTYQYFDSSINPELLRQISAATGGKFYRVEDDAKVFKAVFEDIDKLERHKIETTEQTRYDEKFMKFIQLGFLVFLGTFALQNSILRVYP